MTITHPEPHPCLLCQRTTRADSKVCSTCYLRIAQQLDDLPELYAWAAGEMQPGGGDGRGTEQPLGLRVSALDMRATVNGALGVLATWERDWREFFDIADAMDVGTVDPDELVEAKRRYSRGQSDATGSTLLGLVKFLRQHLAQACREHPAVDEFATDVAHAHAQARSAARITARQAWVISCPSDGCGADLRIIGGDETVTCRSCRRLWDVQWLLRVTAASSDVAIWLDPVSAALLVGISERTLRLWAAKGHVKRDHGMYDIGSVWNHVASERMTS